MFVYKTFYLHAKVQNKIQNSVIQYGSFVVYG